MMERKIVLAIDDENMILDLFKEMLTPVYDVRTVNCASSAAKFLNEEKADVILLDIEMPNISGFEFLNDIKKIPSFYTTPVIVVSSHTGTDFYEKSMGYGANNVLHKPVKKDLLIQSIEKAIAGKK